MFQIIGMALIVSATVFIAFGLYGIFKFDNFYARILVSSKVDIIGSLTLIIGVIIYKGISFFSFKVLILMLMIIIINPLTSHLITRSAYISGYKVEDD